MSYENLLVETRGRVGVIRLNRPQALNALNSVLNARARRSAWPGSTRTPASAAC